MKGIPTDGSDDKRGAAANEFLQQPLLNDGSIRKDSNKKVSPPQPFFDGRSVRTRYISKKVIV
jgi:hypothetical protein